MRYQKQFNCIFHLFSACFLVLALIGCEEVKHQSKAKDEEAEITHEELGESIQSSDLKLPISGIQGSFFTVGGWLDQETIVYVSENVEGANLYSYNIRNGVQELLYSSSHPISTLKVSPTQQYILIHSAPYTAMGMVTVIESTGKIMMSMDIPANELQFEWNEHNENKILITGFSEDWTFNNYVMDITDKSLTEISLPQPFVHFINQEELLYIDWDLETPSTSAPLIKQNLTSSSSVKVLDNVIQMEAFKERILTVTVDQAGSGDKGIYTFYDLNLKKETQWSTPVLSDFSGWVVPFYSYIQRDQSLLLLQPKYSGASDQYAEDFSLYRYSLQSGEGEEVLTGLQNAPISCSPDGSICLQGFQLEKLLLLESKEQVQIVK